MRVRCEQCGKEYNHITGKNGARFCSRECYQAHKAEHKIWTKEKCAQATKDYKARNPHKVAEWRKRNRERNVSAYLWRSCKNTAKRRGIKFTITKDDVPEIPSHCPILGIPIVVEVGRGRAVADGPSIDRIDSTKGYEPNNIQIVSWRANKLKQDASLEELIVLGQWASEVLSD